MGPFRTTIRIESLARRGETRELPDVLVDTGSEVACVPQEVLESLGVRAERVIRFRDTGPVDAAVA
jgi:hypothetical protein